MIIGYSRAGNAVPSVVPPSLSWQFPLSVAPDLPVKRLMPNLRVRDDAGWITTAVPICGTSSTDTWNPSDKSASMTLTNGDTTATNINTFAGIRTVGSHSTGKWYFELTLGDFTGNIFDADGIGIVIGATALTSIAGGVNTLWLREDGLKIVGGVSTGTSMNHIGGLGGGTNIVSFAIDLNTKRAWIRSEFSANQWEGPDFNAADPETGLNGIDVSGIFGPGVAVFPCFTGDNSTTDVVTFNQTFTYAIPSGFCAW